MNWQFPVHITGTRATISMLLKQGNKCNHVTFELSRVIDKRDFNRLRVLPLENSVWQTILLRAPQLQQRLRPVRNSGGRLSRCSAARPTLLELNWNTVLSHSLKRQHVFIYREIHPDFDENISNTGKKCPEDWSCSFPYKAKHRSRARTPLNITHFPVLIEKEIV